MLAELHLDVDGASDRLEPGSLQASAEDHGLYWCLLLPSATPEFVCRVNDHYLATAASHSRLRTLGTLHPGMEHPEDELQRLVDAGCPGIKLSTFSQRFDLDSDESAAMLRSLERAGDRIGHPTVLVLDTFTRADHHFGAPTSHLTTPAKVRTIAQRHPGIIVVGAHMGGLAAPPDELRRQLRPLPNLLLDTSNAAHVLPPDDFVAMLQEHGPSHVLFGTDWPWFDHESEMAKIEGLLRRAGFGVDECASVMSGNARALFAPND